ncbi:MAG: SUMF1/EgtB/PvdO family nonheme iron enzyme [Blastocatellia bacterium]
MTSNPPLPNTATPRPAIFVSYAHQDAEFANQLIADLDANGHACWIDTSSIKGGDEWIITIAEGISASYAFVVIVTRSALDSRWVRDEILWARTENKPIIPLIRENVLRDKRFFLLNSFQGVTLFDSDYAAALPKLLRALPAPTSPETEPDQCRKAELAYLDRLRFEQLLDAEKYTPMGGSSEQRPQSVEMRAVFELLQMTKDHHLRSNPKGPKRFENAVEEIKQIRRAVLLGEPGGGKTTTIWKLAADLVAEAAQDREVPIPLLIRLGRWTDAEQSLPEFVASQLGDLGASLDLLLAEKRAALLLDGLNELPAGQREIKYPQVRQLIEQHPALLAVVSCRELDYTDDLGFDRVNITPLDPIRIREFAGRYLGAEKGEALFWRLAGGDVVRGVWKTWQRAGATFDSFWTATDIPRENPNVYGITSGEQDRVWQEKVRGKHTLMELARNPYMLLMLTSVYAEQGELPENRGELFRLFVETLLKRERIPEDEQAALTGGLARVAFEMQIRRAADKTGDALTVLPKESVMTILDERLLYLAGSASILSVGEQVRFTHQLLQEYFAARCMDIKIKAEELKVYDIWLSDRWWNRTNWEEAAILLAGLYSDDCSPVVEWVAQGNPEVAAQCVKRSGAALAEATQERLRAEWNTRLTDLQDDPKPESRAAVGRALAITGWDNRKGVGTVRDRRGVTLPDIDWVEIPGGEFQYGDESERAAKPQRLTLPAFHISRYPVTYAQFQTFLDDPEGFADQRWFDGLAADDDDHRMDEQEFKFANHPRETVNWYQATAFCRWLSWRLGGGYDLKKVADWAVRLPTEFEWEKAARGTDGRLYPYEGDYDAEKGNTDDTGIGQTSAVGIFPNGESPYSLMDMSGNVWEWCLSNYDKPAEDARKENLRNDKNRVLRGGSWFNGHINARAVSRFISHPAGRVLIGFRVVCVVRPPSLLL